MNLNPLDHISTKPYDGLRDLIPHQPAYPTRHGISRIIAIVCRACITIVQDIYENKGKK